MLFECPWSTSTIQQHRRKLICIFNMFKKYQATSNISQARDLRGLIALARLKKSSVSCITLLCPVAVCSRTIRTSHFTKAPDCSLEAVSKSPTQDLTSTFCNASLTNQSSHAFAYPVLHIVEVFVASFLTSQRTYTTISSSIL